MDKQKRQEMVKRAVKWLSPNGVLVIQDFLWIDDNEIFTVHFRDNWRDEPFSYQTVLWDMAHPELGFQLVAKSNSGRPTEIKVSLGDATLKLASKQAHGG